MKKIALLSLLVFSIVTTSCGKKENKNIIKSVESKNEVPLTILPYDGSSIEKKTIKFNVYVSDVAVNFSVDEELSEKTNPTDISGKRILLVEDNDLNLEVAQFILSDAGAYVIPAKNGKEAVEIVKNSAEGEFDLILMDLIMPVMNGYAATKIIRSMERKDTSIVPIIAMSANTFEQDIQKSLDSGMNEHISKPLNVEKLLTVLNKWIKK